MKHIERENENGMYKVIWQDNERKFDNLNSAMAWAKTLDHFVKIAGGDFEVVGDGVAGIDEEVLWLVELERTGANII